MGLFPKASHSSAHPCAAPAVPALQGLRDLLPLAPVYSCSSGVIWKALFCTAGCCGASQRTILTFVPPSSRGRTSGRERARRAIITDRAPVGPWCRTGRFPWL